MQSPLGDILHLQEIRELIKRLQQMSIEHYCSPKWYLQDQALQKLNLQLHVNAVMKNDEYILEECITQDKFKLLIYDLILTAIWKKEVFPRLQKEISQCNSLKLYLALYHQAVLCNLLEVLMFHRTAIDQSGEYLIELIDYCYKKITRQLSLALKAKRDQSKDTRKQTTSQSKQDEQKMRDKVQSIIKRTPWEQAQAQAEQIEFNLFIMSISILRYLMGK